ncbi:leucyl aminopeptidase [Dermabacteraceae bacterium TAE3-ERU27]|nr:leucyl aminopeptidase [Dermabacteraceae bacterium TAE3-ERU27]
MTTLTVTTATVSEISADAIIVPVLAPAEKGGEVNVLGIADLNPVAAALQAKSSSEAVTRFPAPAGLAAPVVLGVGVGEKDLAEVSTEDLRAAAGAAVRSLAGFARVALAFGELSEAAQAALAEGALLGAYDYTAVRGKDAELTAPVAELVLQGVSDAVARQAEVVAQAVAFARDLVNTPPNLLFPASFAERAREAAAGLPIEVTVLDEKQLAEGSYGGIVGVGQGSSRPPRLVKLSYNPAGAEKHVSIVGKGITFDTGGISLKPGAKMDEMTMDMAGAGSTLATVVAAAKLGLPVRVTGFLALAENMPGGKAQRPGDVVTMRNGKTVEVLNTDAEGRMVMADALVDAAAEKPDFLMDVATLTGAAVLALGNRYAAVMGDDSARERVMSAAHESGEYFWPLPFPKELRASINGRVADLANIGQREGGAMVAGVFLQEFVDGCEWAHLDIAGPAFTGSAHGYMAKGGTGFSVRTMLEVVRSFA